MADLLLRLAGIALSAALLTPGAAHAEDWERLTEADNGVVFWIDRDSIRDVDGYKQAWTRSDYSGVTWGDVLARKALEDYDCVRRAQRTRGTVAYGRDGKVLRTLNLSAEQSEWKVVEAGSIGEAKLEEVCAGA